MTTLNETLTLIAAQIKADAQQLIAYAEEDMVLGGYHIDESLRAWPQGSAWGCEGQILYALVRYLKPETVVEIGGWVGMSASHMALACKANGVGHVTSVDNGVGGQPHGYLIPEYLRQFVTLVPDDGRIWLAKQDPHSIGFLFEDADHSTGLVMELGRLALNKVEPGGILATHDAAHDFAFVGGGQRIDSPVGRAVRDGLEQAGLYFKPYLAEPSDCGLAITVMPGERVDKHSKKVVKDQWAMREYQGAANIESASEPPVVEFKGIQGVHEGFAPQLPKSLEPLATEDNPIVKTEVKTVKKPVTKRKPKTKAK